MAGSTVTMSVAQFAEHLKQKYPQHAALPDIKLVAGFLSKNPKYKANYKDGAFVSVTFEPASAVAAAAASGGTSAVQAQVAGAAMKPADQATLVRPAATMNSPTSIPVVKASTAVSDAGEKTVVNSKPSAAMAAPNIVVPPAPVQPSSRAPYLGKTVIVDASAAATPLMVGKYQIIDELGRGAMGVVYKAFDPGIGRTVALKVMSEELARDAAFRERFLREARGAGILQHPNIVTVHELGEWQGAPFIAMEFLQGHSLEDILKNEKGTTTVDERLKIIAQVCRGLEYAHARGIVHRDIKPANVMVTTDGVAKVVDFGIARLADQKLTTVGLVLGTVSYMSPEQLQGKALDGRSDVFAVGVMLFEVLTSVLPFAAEETGAAIANTLYRQPPKLANFLENCPDNLDDVLRKCLAKDPAERFQTAGELADKLGQVQQELQRSQVAPTVVRSITLMAEPGKAPVPSVSDATEQLSQAALQSLDAAKEWWKVASPGKRRNAITIAIPALLYVQSLIAPRGGFSDTGMGGGFVTSSTIVLPVAILSAIVIAVQLWGQRWKGSPQNVKLFSGVAGFIAAAFCADKIALGLMWYVIFSKIFLVLVLAQLGFFVSNNLKFAFGLWRHGSAKERALSALGLVLLTGYFLVVFSLNFADYVKNWRTSGSGWSEEKEQTAGRATNNQSAPATVPAYPVFNLVRTTSAGAGSITFSPDGNLLVSGSSGEVSVWDAASGQLLRTMHAHSNLNHLVFSPDGRLLASPGELWNVASGELLRPLSDAGQLVAFSSDGALLATTDGSNIVNIWDSATGKIRITFDAQQEVCSVAFVGGNFAKPDSPISQMPVTLATGTNSGTVKMWDAASGKLLSTLTGLQGNVTAIVENSDGHDLATLAEDGIRVWRAVGGKVVLVRIIDGGGSNPVFLQSGNWLASGAGDGRVRFWNISTGEELRPLQAHTRAVDSIAISPNRTWLATAGRDTTLKIWNLH